MAWSYKREEGNFAPLPEGDYRIRIHSAEKAVSKKGRDMLALQFDVSGKNQVLYHYITFLDDKPEITNRQLTNFFDSFKDIADGDFDMSHWIGKVGACRVKHEESDYNGGSVQARIHYFIRVDKQGSLPPWQEPKSGSLGGGGYTGGFTDNASTEEFMPVPEGDGFPLF